MAEEEPRPADEAASFFVEGIECITCIITVVVGAIAFFFGTLNPALLPVILGAVIILFIICACGAVLIYRSRKSELKAKRKKEAIQPRVTPDNCPTCGTKLKGTETFCPQCGAAVGEG